MNEIEYRKRIQSTFDLIENAFEGIDPDVTECEQSQGALTLLLADRSKCILSAQPSIRQLWLALASRGKAYHFNFSEDSAQWLDDRGEGIELMGFLRKYFKDTAGIDLKI